MTFAPYMAYSGRKIVVAGQTGDGIGFQYGEIMPATGAVGFPQIPDVPCPKKSCYNSRMFMLDPDHMLDWNIVPTINKGIESDEVVAVGLEAGGDFNEIDSSGTRGLGLGEITATASSYFALTAIPEDPIIAGEQGFEEGEAGWNFVQQFAPSGLSEGTIELPGHGEDHEVDDGIFSLGSALYISRYGLGEARRAGLGLHIAPDAAPVESEVDGVLGSAMTGFLTGATEEKQASTDVGGLKGLTVKGPIIKLHLSCTGSSTKGCIETAKVLAVETKKGSRIVAVQASRSSKHKVTLADVTVTLAGGQSREVTLTISRAGKALLARFRRLPVELVLSQLSGTTHTTLKSEKLTLRPVRRH